MRRLLVLTLLLFGCDNRSAEQVKQDQQSTVLRDANTVLNRGTIVCADGNQVRMAVYAIGTNASAFSGWTVLDPDGKPKRCVKRPRPVQQQYEEVPQ